MTPRDVIMAAQERAAEWLEMAEDPAEMLAGILATKIVELQNYVEYLEKRVNHDSRTRSRLS